MLTFPKINRIHPKLAILHYIKKGCHDHTSFTLQNNVYNNFLPDFLGII